MRTPLLLLLFCVIPVGAGVVRLVELARGAAITPDNARFFAAPLPITLHIVGACAFAVLGALQVTPWLRRRSPGWHRRLGWLLVPCAAVAVLSGLWMQTFSPRPEPLSPLLWLARWLFGGGLLVCLALGVRAALRRDYARHGAWLLRAYAIALGAGTQSLLIVPWVVTIGLPSPPIEALLMTAAWLINLLLVERFVPRYPPSWASARRASAIS